MEYLLKQICSILESEEKFNKKTFKGRYNYGYMGELLVHQALARQIVQNNGWVPAPEVIGGQNNSVHNNARNGDVYFTSFDTRLVEFMDVKATNFVSQDSLDVFREDGWYFLNALVESSSMPYFMIRNNQAFKDYLKANAQHLRDDNKNGYRLNFSDIPPNPKDYGLELYSHMDASKYLKLIRELKRALVDKCPDLIKDAGREPATNIKFTSSPLEF